MAPPLTVFFAGFLPAIFVVCVYVSVNNGVCVGGKRSEAFENLNVESSDFLQLQNLLKKSRIEWITASSTRNNLARKMSRAVPIGAMSEQYALDTF